MKTTTKAMLLTASGFAGSIGLAGCAGIDDLDSVEASDSSTGTSDVRGASGQGGVQPDSKSPRDSVIGSEPTLHQRVMPISPLNPETRASILTRLVAADPSVEAQASSVLEGVSEPEPGVYVVDDVCFKDEASLSDYLSHLTSREKGYYAADKLWTDTSLSVCFVAAGNATAAEITRAADLVALTWEQYIPINFIDWDTCSGSNDAADIKVFFDSSITRGCSFFGTDISTSSGVACGAGSSHAWADIVIPAAPSGDPDGLDWREYTVVHEFGHALGLYHEHDRSDYNTVGGCASATNNATNQGGDDTMVGTFDEDSIMYYCAPNQPSISKGDIDATRVMYGWESSSLYVRHRNWVDGITVDFAYDDEYYSQRTWSNEVNSDWEITQFTGSPGTTHQGDAFTLTATPDGAPSHCKVAPLTPTYTRGGLNLVPGVGFGVIPMEVECYDYSLISLVVN